VCLAVKPVGEPDAGNPHVRFDERGWETGRCRMAPATAPILDSTEAAVRQCPRNGRYRGQNGHWMDGAKRPSLTHSCQSTVNFVVVHNEPHDVVACGRRPLGGSVRQRRATSRKPAKTQHGSTRKPERNKVPTAARSHSSTLADLQQQVSALTRENSRRPLSKGVFG